MTSAAPTPSVGASRPRGDRRAADFLRRHSRAVAIGIAVAAVTGFAVFVLPQISGLSGTLARLRNGDHWWLVAGIGFEALSLGAYVLLFRTVFACHRGRIGWRASYQITLAGAVASKLLATAGAGGVALTAWALRGSGLTPRAIARRMLGFELLLYGVFGMALVLTGLGLRSGVLPGRAPWTLTVLPAAIGALAIVAMVALRAIPSDLERRIAGAASGSSRLRRWLRWVATVPGALRGGTATALELIRERNLGVLGAPCYWGFDIATLWASFHAFGSAPPIPVIVMAYFVGQLANTLPLPGGVGGVEGGMIGALLAFGVHGSLAVLAVLSYRLISFWLPTAPGALAYVRLRETVARWRNQLARQAA